MSMMFLRTEFIRILFLPGCFFFYYRRPDNHLLVSSVVDGKMIRHVGEANVNYESLHRF